MTEIELLEKEENANNALRLNAFGEIDEDARTLTAKLTGDGDVVATGDQEIILKTVTTVIPARLSSMLTQL